MVSDELQAALRIISFDDFSTKIPLTVRKDVNSRDVSATMADFLQFDQSVIALVGYENGTSLLYHIDSQKEFQNLRSNAKYRSGVQLVNYSEEMSSNELPIFKLSSSPIVQVSSAAKDFRTTKISKSRIPFSENDNVIPVR